LKTLLLVLSLSSFSVSALAVSTSLKHCNLSYAIPLVKEAIAGDQALYARADLRTLKITYFEASHPNPYISRSEPIENSKIIEEYVLTGSFEIRAEVTLKTGERVELLHEFYRGPKFRKERAGLPITIALHNKYYRNSNENIWISNACSVMVDRLDGGGWYYVNPGQQKDSSSDVINNGIFVNDQDDYFDKNELPYIH
jgi:hypothetical protein